MPMQIIKLLSRNIYFVYMYFVSYDYKRNISMYKYINLA